MPELAEVLGWKFNHEPGLRTKEGKLEAWPDTLGPYPTRNQLEAWTLEYETAQAQPSGQELNLARITELLTISRSTWTTAQLREIVELIAIQVS